MEMAQVEDRLVAHVRRVVPMTELPAFYDWAFGAVMEAVTGAGGTPTGAPFGWYHGMPAETADVAPGVPVDGLPVGAIAGGEVTVGVRPGGRAAVALHVGSYDGLADSYGRLMAWIGEQGLEPRGDTWEEYLTDPSAEPDQSTWQTRLVVPVR